MSQRINRCSHCGCDEPILGIDGKLYCDNCGMCLEKLEGGLTQNKIEEVAALFGKKLGEEFRVVSDNGLSCICRFDENNILEIKDMRGRWAQNYAINYVILGELLKGKANIVGADDGK